MEVLQKIYWAKDMKQNKAKQKREKHKGFRTGPVPGGRNCEGASFHTLRNPLTGWDNGHLSTSEENAAIGVWKTKCRKFCTEIRADQHCLAWDMYLHAHQSRWGLDAETQALEVRPPGEV